MEELTPERLSVIPLQSTQEKASPSDKELCRRARSVEFSHLGPCKREQSLASLNIAEDLSHDYPAAEPMSPQQSVTTTARLDRPKKRCNLRYVPIAQTIVVLIIVVAVPIFAVFRHRSSRDELQRFSLQEFRLARCLDGSAASYYFRPGQRADQFVIHLKEEEICFCEHGPQCPDWVNCSSHPTYQRRIMSSIEFSRTEIWTNETYLIPSDLSTANFVLLPGCTQDSFLGLREAPTPSGLHFFGRHVFAALLQALRRDHGLDSASVVLLHGTSAGGFGVLHNLDFLAEQLPSRVDVLGIVNAGFLIPFHPYSSPTSLWQPDLVLRNMIEAYNATPLLSRTCLEENRNASHLCLFPPHLHNHIRRPFFLLQSLYDLFQLFRVLDVPREQTPDVLDFMRLFGENLSLSLSPLQNSTVSGVFATSCLEHEIAPATEIQGVSAAAAVSCWYRTRSATCSAMDAPWPIQFTCGGSR